MITLVVEVQTGTPFVFTYETEAEAIAEARNFAAPGGRRCTVYVPHGNPQTRFDRIAPAQIFTIGSLDTLGLFS